jgi:hypothetical protein
MYFNNATASGEALGVTGLTELHPPPKKPSNSMSMVGLFFMSEYTLRSKELYCLRFFHGHMI